MDTGVLADPGDAGRGWEPGAVNGGDAENPQRSQLMGEQRL